MPASARRDEILQAFVRETAAVGSTSRASLRAIAEQADCTTPMIYRLFGSRLGLVRDAVRWTYAKVLSRLELAASTTSLSCEQRLRMLAEYVGTRPLGAQEVFEAVLSLECRTDAHVAREVRGVFVRMHAELRKILQSGIDSGELGPEIDAPYFAWRLLGLGLLDSQFYLLGLSEVRAQGVLQKAFADLVDELFTAGTRLSPPRSPG